MSEQHEHAGKKWKPGPKHPWKNAVSSKTAKEAKEKSELSYLNSYLKGGGKPGR